jgi:hypothetical protein
VDKLKDFLLSLLTYIGESPFRLFTVVFLCLFTFLGWVAYSEKDAFMTSYRAQQALPRMNGEYEKASNFIFKNSQAELVAIFEVNTLLNTRKLVYFATRKSGQDKTMYGTDVGLLTKNYDNNNDVISMMSGKIPCQTYEKPQSLMGFIYVEKGVKWMCRISVPAEPGIFIGQISVGWTEVPQDKQPVDTQQTVMTVASGLLYNKK